MAFEEQNTQGLILFSHINRLGSLAATAELLGVSRSSVSKQLAALERKIGARLFNRTTRKLALTEVGHQVLKEAHKVERALQAIAHISEDSQSVVAGDLNVSCAAAQGRVHLVPLLTEFLARYPEVNVHLQLEDRFVDLVAENMDVSIRFGHLPDSSLIARKLGELSGILCASPEYLKTAPPLNNPSDLIHHRCLFYRNTKNTMNTWTFAHAQGQETVTVSGPLTINDPGALVTAALAHTGVVLMDQSLLGDTLTTGRLVPVLPEYEPVGSFPVYAVYLEKEFIPAKTRAFVDFLIEKMPEVFESN